MMANATDGVYNFSISPYIHDEEKLPYSAYVAMGVYLTILGNYLLDMECQFEAKLETCSLSYLTAMLSANTVINTWHSIIYRCFQTRSVEKYDNFNYSMSVTDSGPWVPQHTIHRKMCSMRKTCVFKTHV